MYTDFSSYFMYRVCADGEILGMLKEMEYDISYMYEQFAKYFIPQTDAPLLYDCFVIYVYVYCVTYNKAGMGNAPHEAIRLYDSILFGNYELARELLDMPPINDELYEHYVCRILNNNMLQFVPHSINSNDVIGSDIIDRLNSENSFLRDIMRLRAYRWYVGCLLQNIIFRQPIRDVVRIVTKGTMIHFKESVFNAAKY